MRRGRITGARKDSLVATRRKDSGKPASRRAQKGDEESGYVVEAGTRNIVGE